MPDSVKDSRPHVPISDSPTPATPGPGPEMNANSTPEPANKEALEFPRGSTLVLIILALCLSILVMSLGT